MNPSINFGGFFFYPYLSMMVFLLVILIVILLIAKEYFSFKKEHKNQLNISETKKEIKKISGLRQKNNKKS